MTLEEALKKINDLFDTKIAEIRWNIQSDIANRLIEDLDNAREWIITAIDELPHNLSPEQLNEELEFLVNQAREETSKEYEESPLDLTTSFEENAPNNLILLEDVQQRIYYNIDQRIYLIIQGAIREEPTPILINIFDPGFLKRNHLDIEIYQEMADEISENFSEQIESIREQVNNLISLRESLTQQSINVDRYAYINIQNTIDQILAKIATDSESTLQRIREILLKVASQNPGATEQAIEFGISESDINILQSAAIEYSQERRNELSEIIDDSERAEYIASPIRIHIKEKPSSPEEILEKVYQDIISQSDEEDIFEGKNLEDTIDQTPEQINQQIHLYLEHILLGVEIEEEFDEYIVNYVANIAGRIDNIDSILGVAHLRIQESLNRVSLEYDVFDGFNDLTFININNNSNFIPETVMRFVSDGSDNNNSVAFPQNNAPVVTLTIMGGIDHLMEDGSL